MTVKMTLSLLSFTAGGHIPEFVVPHCGWKRVFSATRCYVLSRKCLKRSDK